MSVTANLTTNVETITATIVVEDETIIAQVSAAARGPAGPAGPGGGTNSVTSATTSDGTANLSLSNVTTATATVTGTLTAPHIHGNLAGSVYAHIRAGEALAKGDPVYVSSSHGSGANLIPIVSKADASNAAKMPAVGIMDAAVANNANGHMVIVGTITELNTTGLTVNAELYVAAGGGMTATPPTARAQPVARVERVNANNGAVIVKVNGLSASDATGNTLVRRTSGGDASFGKVNATQLDVSGVFEVSEFNPVTFGLGSELTFNGTSYTYGTGAASAHRIALGAGTTGTALFGAADAAAARNAIRTKVVQAADLSVLSSSAVVGTDLVITLIGGVDYLIRGVFDMVSGTQAAGQKMEMYTTQDVSEPFGTASGVTLGTRVAFASVDMVALASLRRANFWTYTGAVLTRRVQFEICIKLVSTGDIQFFFAQAAPGATASVFKAGSFLTAEIL
jgi:hypothetical protein